MKQQYDCIIYIFIFYYVLFSLVNVNVKPELRLSKLKGYLNEVLIINYSSFLSTFLISNMHVLRWNDRNPW